MDLAELIQKYSVSGPRYTSYPTAPQWTEQMTDKDYIEEAESFRSGDVVALYVHIPFCESLCLYCGCNIHLTRNHGVEKAYVDHLIVEMERVRGILGTRPKVSQVAWGGGTPTFLSPNAISRLYKAMSSLFDIEPGAEVGIEIDPRVTSDDHLRTLRELGFTRVSLGVQDFQETVQKAIHRVQSAESTKRQLDFSRALGFTGINYDLIYGLPYQTSESFSQTITEVVAHRPDRIALYNYAHLPELRPHQRALEPLARPDGQLRTRLFEMAYRRLIEAGYLGIGMDHFALPQDDLSYALADRRLYRNFQGYTVKRADRLLGFGASAISDLESAYFQSERTLVDYYRKVSSGGLGVFRGLRLKESDRRNRWVIQELMCRFSLRYDDYESLFQRDFLKDYPEPLDRMKGLEADELIILSRRGLEVTESGRIFVRNAAMMFDEYLNSEGTYSKTL